MSTQSDDQRCTDERSALLGDSDVATDDNSGNDEKPHRSPYLQDNEEEITAGESLLAEHENIDAGEETSCPGDKTTLQNQCLLESSDYSKSRTPDALPSNNFDNLIDNKKGPAQLKRSSVGKTPNRDTGEKNGAKLDTANVDKKHRRKVERPVSYFPQRGAYSSHNLLPSKHFSTSGISRSVHDLTQRPSQSMDPDKVKPKQPPPVEAKSKSTQDLFPIPGRAGANPAPDEYDAVTLISKDPSTLSVLDKKAAFIEKVEKQLPPTKAMRRRAEQERLDKVMYL